MRNSDIGISPGAERRRSALILWTTLGLALAACGGSSKPATEPIAPLPTEVKPDENAWRDQSLAISVEGYMFQGGTEPAAASWVGSGAWIGPNLAVTNAHVALRGLHITAKDDRGQEFEFSEVVAIDQNADLAIIRASNTKDRPALTIIDTPNEIKDLRGTDIRVVGNTGGLGLSFYKGRITNVVGSKEEALLLHDANTAGGSSGGPLIDQNSGKLVGINHSSMPALNAKGAAPAWIVGDLLAKANKSQGLPFEKAFAPADLPINWLTERAICMKPGEAFKGIVNAVGTNDLVVHIKPAQVAPMAFLLLQGGSNTPMAQAMLSGETIGAWTLAAKGSYVYALVNPKDASGPICSSVRFGRIDWAQRLN